MLRPARLSALCPLKAVLVMPAVRPETAPLLSAAFRSTLPLLASCPAALLRVPVTRPVAAEAPAASAAPATQAETAGVATIATTIATTAPISPERPPFFLSAMKRAWRLSVASL